MALENGIDFYGGSAREAGWYEKPGRIVAIFEGKHLLWKSAITMKPFPVQHRLERTRDTSRRRASRKRRAAQTSR